MADTRAKWLLGVAALLAIARFVLVPWVEAQNAQREQLEVLTQRLDRSEGVVRNRDAILQARDGLVQESAAMFSVYPSAADEDPRLAAQRSLNALATRAGLQVTLFDWLLEGEVSEAGLAYGRASVRLEGPLDKLILMHGELEGSMPSAAVRELQVRLRGPAGGPTAAPASASLVIDIFYRPAPSAQESAP